MILTSLVFLLTLQDAPAPESTGNTNNIKITTPKSGPTYVIQDPAGSRKVDAPKVFVESGSETIVGSPEESLKAAYRTWDNACTHWKNEMKRLNRRNLIQASCGNPKKSEESDSARKFYVYKSDAKFKVRVIGK